MPRTKEEMRKDKVTAFMDALANYVRAETHPQEDDEIGSFHEAKSLEDALEELLEYYAK
jgi:hypothetical protein